MILSLLVCDFLLRVVVVVVCVCVCVCVAVGALEKCCFISVSNPTNIERERVDCKNKNNARRREGFKSRYYEGWGGGGWGDG